MISTPQTGIDSLLATYSLLGLPLAIIRAFVALITGIIGGVLTNIFNKENILENKSQKVVAEKISNTKGSKRFLGMFKYAFVEFLQEIVTWLVIGLALAALVAVLVPDDFFATYINNNFAGMLILLIAAIPLYVCATASVPIAAVLMLKGFSPGAALVFLMAGPATNLATMAVLGNVFGRKTLLIYLFSIISGALLFGGLIDTVFPQDFFQKSLVLNNIGEHSSHLLPEWMKIAASVILGLLIINGLYREHLRGLIKKIFPPKQISRITSKTLIIKGITCNNCKIKIESNLKKIDGIDQVEIDIKSSEVKISGDEIETTQIQKMVEDLGYDYQGEKKHNAEDT